MNFNNIRRRWFWGLLIGIGIAVLLDWLIVSTTSRCFDASPCSSIVNIFLLGLRFFVPAGAIFGLFFGLLLERKFFLAFATLAIGLGILYFLIFMRSPSVLEVETSQQVPETYR